MERAGQIRLGADDVAALAEATGLPLLEPGSVFIADRPSDILEDEGPIAGPKLKRDPPGLSDDLRELEDAIEMGDHDLIEAFLDRSPNLNAHYGPYKGFPLLWGMSAEGRSSELAAMLVRGGADPRFATPDGYTALHHIAGYLFEEDAENLQKLVAVLREAGADIEARTSMGDTPLLRSIAHGSTKEMAALLAHDADPDVKSDCVEGQGLTALMQAATDPDKVELLLDCGADLHAVNSQGQTAAEFVGAHLNSMPKAPSRFRQRLGAKIDPEREALEHTLELLLVG